jgi:hypothetical protein
VHGQLEQLGLSSLLVILEMERKSGILVLSRGSASGRIWIRQGAVVQARVEAEPLPPGAALPEAPPVGAAAVYRMLTWTTGRFDFAPQKIDLPDEVRSSTTNLLMEGARLIDEANK